MLFKPDKSHFEGLQIHVTINNDVNKKKEESMQQSLTSKYKLKKLNQAFFFSFFCHLTPKFSNVKQIKFKSKKRHDNK